MSFSYRGPPGARYVPSPLVRHRDALRTPSCYGSTDCGTPREGALFDAANAEDALDAISLLDEQEAAGPWSLSSVCRGITYGLVTSVLNIPSQVGYTSIIFQDDVFRPIHPQLVKLVLWSAFVHQVVFSFRSTMPFAMGQVQDAGLIFLSAIATSTVHHVPVDNETGLPGPQAVPTACCTLALSTALLGVMLFITGKLRAAFLVQYLPMPVVSGYLAFIGLFCTEAGLALSTGQKINTSPQSWLLLFSDGATVAKAAASSLTGLALLLVANGCDHPVALPAVIASLPAAFYAVVFIAGGDTDAARDDGWLTTPVPQESGLSGFLSLFSVFDLSMVDWGAAARQLPTWLGMYFVVAFSSCLDVAAIEMELRRHERHVEPLDASHELGSVIGVSNLISGLTGGFTGSYIISLTVFTLRTCRDIRLCGWTCGAMSLVMVFAPFTATDYVPKFVFGGALIYIGFDMIYCWLLLAVRKLAWQESLIVIAAFVLINMAGLELGLVMGIAVSAAAFIFEHANSPIVVRVRKVSGVLRSPEQREYLRQRYQQIVQLELHGHLFFGSALAVLREVKKHIRVPASGDWDAAEHPVAETGTHVALAPLTSLRRVVAFDPTATPKTHASQPTRLQQTRFVVMDFAGVRGVDTTAVRTCFLSLRQELRSYNVVVVFAGMADSVLSQFTRGDMLDDEASCVICADLDAALEYCEERFLSVAKRADVQRALFPQHRPAPELVRAALERLSRTATADQLRGLSEVWTLRSFSAGQPIYAPGDPYNDLFVLVGGNAELRPAVSDDAGDDGSYADRSYYFARLRPGSLFGDAEWQLRQRRSHYALAVSGGAQVAVLTADAQRELSPELRQTLTELVVNSLSVQLLSAYGER